MQTGPRILVTQSWPVSLSYVTSIKNIIYNVCREMVNNHEVKLVVGVAALMVSKGCNW